MNPGFSKEGEKGGGGGGHTTSAEGARFLGRFGEMLPQKVLKISVSETAISYSFNRIRDVFVKK